ncbi:SH3 domain-containing protein [Campylobacter sp. US33a]|uniref:SH3 domain-containing protein n=1 Tax=Campylobacter sp. CCS1377 TaxID=3158229 RepID=A0AAU7E8J3_9BACT|nr:SH3 domain-containing protein [Campylobacter sp. US33a]MCW1360401.1 SH3 domain-containing protein [Campylobacter jejuni]TEY02666.1 hypothetical protein ELQ16_04615 [Campylobacter sp. US33a]
MKFLFYLFFSFTILFAQMQENSVFEQNSKTINPQEIYKHISPSDELGNYEENIKDPFIPSGVLALNVQDYKTSVLVDEVFAIVLNAQTNENTDFDFLVELEKTDDLIFLNPDLKWIKNGNTYTATLWFQAKTSNANLSKISVFLSRNKEVFQEASLLINPIKFEKVDSDKNYSHIVADSLNVGKVKTSYFDDKNVIMMVELNATNANLQNFNIANITKQGIENFKGDYNASSAFYFAVFSPSKSNFEFSYFNTQTMKLETINLKVEISEESISTQSDLNPRSNSLVFYKQIALWILTFICIAIFIFKKKFIILGLGIIFLIWSFLINSNTQTAILKANSRAKILPTSQSTYFYTNTQEERVEILNTRDNNYTKVIFSNGKIGWVENENLRKD